MSKIIKGTVSKVCVDCTCGDDEEYVYITVRVPDDTIAYPGDEVTLCFPEEE